MCILVQWSTFSELSFRGRSGEFFFLIKLTIHLFSLYLVTVTLLVLLVVVASWASGEQQSSFTLNMLRMKFEPEMCVY